MEEKVEATELQGFLNQKKKKLEKDYIITKKFLKLQKILIAVKVLFQQLIAEGVLKVTNIFIHYKTN